MTTALQIQESRSVSLFPTEQEWAMLKEQASMLVKTGFLPVVIKTAEQAIAIALKGRELGIPPMQAFAHIHIIQGKPTISSELMLGLIFKNCQGATIHYLENTPQKCVIEAKRPGGKASQFEFTIEQAQKANLLSKDSWRNYPSAMLRARAVSMTARALFPDAIMGCGYTPEELGADVNDKGDILDVQSTSEPASANIETKSPEIIKPMTRVELGAAIMEVAGIINLNDTEMVEWINERYGKTMKTMTMTEMQDFYGVLSAEKKGA